MTQLKNKIQLALDESRMLILGAQILIGFAFTATFQDGFGKLPRVSQDLNTIALTLLLITMGLLIWPAVFHQVAERGQDTARLHRLATRAMDFSLALFAAGLGINIYVPVSEISGGTTGVMT